MAQFFLTHSVYWWDRKKLRSKTVTSAYQSSYLSSLLCLRLISFNFSKPKPLFCSYNQRSFFGALSVIWHNFLAEIDRGSHFWATLACVPVNRENIRTVEWLRWTPMSRWRWLTSVCRGWCQLALHLSVVLRVESPYRAVYGNLNASETQRVTAQFCDAVSKLLLSVLFLADRWVSAILQGGPN